MQPNFCHIYYKEDNIYWEQAWWDNGGRGGQQMPTPGDATGPN